MPACTRNWLPAVWQMHVVCAPDQRPCAPHDRHVELNGVELPWSRITSSYVWAPEGKLLLIQVVGHSHRGVGA